MKKYTATSLLSLFLAFSAWSQCVLVPQTLSDRVSESKLIVEGTVVAHQSSWNAQHTMIYTSHTVTVTKIFKGSGLMMGNQVSIVSEGGEVGDVKIKAEPVFETETGDKGVFFITTDAAGNWVAVAGPQGVIRYDMATGTAADVFYSYKSLTDVYSQVKALTGITPADMGNIGKVGVTGGKRSAPTITSIFPKTLTAGNNISVKIKGTNFGAVQDTSSVQFKNGDDGGATYVKAMKYDYVSWTDTQIVVKIRTKAGTGKPRVVIKTNGIANSPDTLNITYSHLNVVSGDSIGYETQEIGLNGPGIIWKLNKKFNDSTTARNTFMRALERWRCGTYMNWDTSGRVTQNLVASDGINLALWDSAGLMPSGVLAQCFSYWSGCFVSGNLKWYVNELDIRFRMKPTGTTTWNYTGSSTPSTKYDFESVATHELGHGHQLGHVINANEIMHYAIANGQTKRNLSTGDLSGGGYVIGKSIVSVCGKTAMTKLTNANCALVAPLAKFGVSKSNPCLNESIVITDSSKGTINSYSWDFGANAVPATASTAGPHTVKYTAGGSKTITLTISTPVGNKVTTMTVVVKADDFAKSSFTWSAGGKNLVTFTNTSVNATSSKWFFGDGDSAVTTNTSHNYSASGNHTVTLRSMNTCNTKDTTINVRFVMLNFFSDNTAPCINQPIVFHDSSDASIQTYNWNFGANATPAGKSGVGPHTVSYSASGPVTVKLDIITTFGTVQSYSKTAYVTVGSNTYVKASFTYSNGGNNIIHFASNSAGTATGYTWYFGDGDSSTLQNPEHPYSGSATGKSVRLVVKGPCNTDDTTITLRNFTAVQEVLDNKIIVLQPNPAKEYFQVLPYFSGTGQLVISAITGQVIMQKPVYEGTMLTIHTAEFAKGVYTVTLMKDGAALSKQKLIIE